MTKKRSVIKAEFYETLAVFNGAISVATDSVMMLRAHGLRAETERLAIARLREVEASINSEVLEKQRELELQDWGKHGRTVRRLEKRMLSDSE